MAHTVINMSTDSMLRDTRFRIMANAGIAVISVQSVAAAEATLQARSVDAIIICDTVGVKDMQRLAKLAKAKGVGVLVIHSVVPPPAEQLFADTAIGRLEDPA